MPRTAAESADVLVAALGPARTAMVIAWLRSPPPGDHIDDAAAAMDEIARKLRQVQLGHLSYNPHTLAVHLATAYNAGLAEELEAALTRAGFARTGD